MAGYASVMSDDSWLSRLDRAVFRLETVMALISGLAAFSLMIFAVVSVGGRNIFNQPLRGYVDWIQLIMPLIAFAGISYTQRQGGHIRMDILLGRLRGRVLWSVEFLSTLCILIVMVLLVWGSWAHFQRSFDFSMPNWSRDSSVDIGLPIWPAKLIVPVAFAVLSLRLCLQLWGYGRAIRTGTQTPVAVPLIEDAATVAAAEAESVSGLEQADG